ncbi:MAG: sigma factor [Vicinamibacterales bacterium]
MADRDPDGRRKRVTLLYDEHGPSLYRYALMLLANAAAAEDAVQQVFAAVLASSRPIHDERRYLSRSCATSVTRCCGSARASRTPGARSSSPPPAQRSTRQSG